MAEIQWGLLGQLPDIGGNAMRAFDAGQQKAMNKSVGGKLATNDYTGAQQEAFRGGNFELADYASQRQQADVTRQQALQDRERAALKRKYETGASAAYTLVQTPVAQRAALFEAVKPRLKAEGWSDQDLSGVNLADDAYLNGLVSQGVDLATQLKRGDDQRDFALKERKQTFDEGQSTFERNQPKYQTVTNGDGSTSIVRIDPVGGQYTTTASGQPAPGQMGGGDNNFTQSLVQSESSGNWGALNKEGYGGRLQFGNARLADAAKAGLVPAGTTGAQFSRMPPATQKAVEDWHFRDIDSQASSKGLDRYVGQTIAGVPITPDSIRAMSHLGGVDGARKFIETGGRYNPADSNGTRLSDYGRRFGARPGSPVAQAGNVSTVFQGTAKPKEQWVDTTQAGIKGQKSTTTGEFKAYPAPKGNTKAAEAQKAASTQALTLNQEIYRLANELVGTGKTPTARPGFTANYGLPNPTLWIPGTAAQTAKAYVDQLTGILTLDNTKLLKGAMSDKDLAILQRASTVLNNRNISDADAITEIARVRDVAKRVIDGKSPGTGASTPQTKVINGVTYTNVNGTWFSE